MESQENAREWVTTLYAKPEKPIICCLNPFGPIRYQMLHSEFGNLIRHVPHQEGIEEPP